jgi:hypothetical protein
LPGQTGLTVAFHPWAPVFTCGDALAAPR